MRRLCVAAFCGVVLPLAAGEMVENVEPAEDEVDFKPAFDALTVQAEWLGEIDFDNSFGSLQAERYTLGSFLHKPWEFSPDWYLLTALDYRLTSLDSSNLPVGVPVLDGDYHEFTYYGIAYHYDPASKWMYGAWAAANLASDLEHVNGDDFNFDVALGAAYFVNDRFLLGGGIAALALGNDPSILAGPGFYWKANDAIDMFLVGTMFNATWRPVDDFSLTLRVRPFGDSWNVETLGQSRQLDFDSYTIRLHAEHRLYKDLWLSAGIGWSFANEVEYRTTSGTTLWKDDLNTGPTASIALRVRTW